ncbi:MULTISPECIES: PIG-L deacetylase family protein [Gordonia]|uniref:PIG-L family deacetylase n=1 Tax=Gordonia tangerina TaxID=2911060 RepID=A0ABS9DLP1_9ACTN|nr:PIG-L family deacetylase [Gordonia tangerina]MCF3940152.1 PIG-L family deacetylase [Gordonia tangerina]
MRSLRSGEVTEIGVLGAHCDDIAIGMGATLLTLARARPGLTVHALVLSGAGTAREVEEKAALTALTPGADLHLTVLDVPDGRAPTHWGRIKDALGEFRRTCEPDVVFATQRHDAHQDHRLLAELVPTEFRDHLVLGYEILKWETDTPAPSLFHPVDAGAITEKVRLLHAHYPSQRDRDWFDDETFLGLARVRGVQCHSRYAEAFVTEKSTIDFGG